MLPLSLKKKGKMNKRIFSTLLVSILMSASVCFADAQNEETTRPRRLIIDPGMTLEYEGATDNAFETFLVVTDPTADRTVTFKNESGTVAYLSDISGSAYAMFYGLTAGTGMGGTDYAATVAVKTTAGTGRVPFPQNGAASGIVRADTSSFTLPTVGTYEVSWRVHTTEPGQLALELDGTKIDSSTAVNMNPTSGGHPIIGHALITTVSTNQVLAVINPAGNSTALTITPADGSNTHANSQSITIRKL